MRQRRQPVSWGTGAKNRRDYFVAIGLMISFINLDLSPFRLVDQHPFISLFF
jgi:hypothetical protein